MFLANPIEQLPILLPGLDIHVYDLFDSVPCNGTCGMTQFVECVPHDQTNCRIDETFNIGNNNVGLNNWGNSNQGSYNIGSNNMGNSNRGSNNTGTGLFCNNLQQGQGSCTLDMLRTAETVYM
ncbi:hypothetical protein F751_1712 [Auxenochlorella protothecoides]|uniref:Uncharacterized protein n=1 Tax=Auxenochlorella protothecoides TaxID=3075 RepID=A0A087SGH9_AUXPR|nr:hypothetical protein F751_1712 [Auxenochlorella protothecoides]KFM24833.1 hypothetical protein F751_1712 [Auxenochlorella protothecoides]